MSKISTPETKWPDVRWLPDMVLLDLETTGATPISDRITEIALIRIQEGEITDSWQTLINPQTPIPPFISRLTGISNDMVKDAPTFADIAAELFQYLDGMTLAAHNVRFDYGFLKAEYQRIHATLRLRTLCTVKLSRKLFPTHQGHGLDAIMKRHGLHTEHRHRAMGDVEVVMDYLQLARTQLGSNQVINEIRTLSQGPALPARLDQSLIDKMPDTPGVYLFYGDGELPIYIGKSIKLRSRVLNHFSSDHSSSKEMKICQEVQHIEWIETAGEIGALLLESKLIKEKQPVYNRRLRRTKQLHSLKLTQDAGARPWVSIISHDQLDTTEFGQLYGMFHSKRTAIETLREIATEHKLCHKILGLELGKGPCFAYQLKRCSGVCVGQESENLHFLRLKQALTKIRLQIWPYQGKIGIQEQQANTSFSQIHIFDQWCHLATVQDESELNDALLTTNELSFDQDTYKLLRKAFNMPLKIIHFHQ